MSTHTHLLFFPFSCHPFTSRSASPPRSGVGDFSVWEFSGNPVYYCSYDYFAANDATAIHLVLFSLEEPYETQLSHITYWLNLLKALTLPPENIRKAPPWLFRFQTLI